MCQEEVLDKLLYLMELQYKLNDLTNGEEWLYGSNKHGKTIRWGLCISMEAAELIDSLPWKHWKDVDQEPDYDNVLVESVDILHFVLSYVMEDIFTRHQLKLDGKTLDKILELTRSDLDPNNRDSEYNMWYVGKIPVYMNTTEDKKQKLYLENLIEGAKHLLQTSELHDIDNVVDSYLYVLDLLEVLTGYGFDYVYKLYLGKYALNILRQNYGYSSGVYTKIWDSEKNIEDNVYMVDVVKKNDIVKWEDAYSILEQIYLNK